MRWIVMAVTVVISVDSAQAQEAASYQTLLLPVRVLQQPGANGSLWTTTLLLLNDASRTLRYNDDVLPLRSCAGGGPCVTELPPEMAALIDDPFPSVRPVPGLLMYVRRDVANDVRLAMRLRDLNSPENSSGVSIPVVRERDFRTSATHLLPIQPTNESHRTLLRVYDPDVRATAAVRVRVYALFSTGIEPLIADRVLVLQPPTQPAQGRPYFPGYTEVAIDTAFLGRNDLSPRISLRLKVEPLTPGLRHWAMVSMTSNTTNEVTIVTPEL